MLFDPSAININVWAFELVKSIASPYLNYIMMLLAESFFAVIPAVVLYMYFRKDKNVYSFIVAFVLFYAVSELLKFLFAEPRPCAASGLDWINSAACESGFAFPSNHALTLTGLAFFFKNYRYLRVLYLVWLLVVLFGRVYLGQHYLTDVLAGAILSIGLYYLISVYKNRINGLLNSLVHRVSPRIALR